MNLKSTLAIVLLLSSFALVVNAQDAKTRVWTDASGKFKITASFVEFKDGNVVLKMNDGKTLKVPVGKLSPVDQRVVRELVKSPTRQGNSNGDWAWWRGPNFNGTANGPAPPTEWSDSKNVEWKASIPGRGHSSPTVVGDSIYFATADERAQTQSVVCLERATGKEKWQTIVGRGGFPQIHNKNTHASQTVACDGERLFITFLNNNQVTLTALGLDGKQLWQKVVGSFQPKAYKYGYAASPLIYKSNVVVVGDCDTGSFLKAYDRKSGNVAWQGSRPAKLSWSSPIVANVAGKDQLLLSGGEYVTSYDPNTGRQNWQTAATTMATCGTMIWEGDLVFASGGYPKPETVCIKGDGSGQIVWQNNQKCYEQSLLVSDGHIYAVTDKGVGYCWNAATGEEKWVQRLRGPVSASPILAGGNIYACDERGTTFVFRANPTKFEPVAQNQLGTESFATPTICGGKIYLRVAQGDGGGRQEFLYCIGNDS